MSNNQLIRHLLGVPIALPLLSAPSFVLLVPYLPITSQFHAQCGSGIGEYIRGIRSVKGPDSNYLGRPQQPPNIGF